MALRLAFSAFEVNQDLSERDACHNFPFAIGGILSYYSHCVETGIPNAAMADRGDFPYRDAPPGPCRGVG